VKRLGDVAKQLSPADIRALFPDGWWHQVFSNQSDAVPVHFVDGSVAIDGDLIAGTGPWNLVIHGDLHATGDLDFATGDYKESLLVVLGGVRARNFRFTNGATCVIAHDLVVNNYVFGRYGDESAHLEVGGTLRARALLLDHVTGTNAGTLDAICCTVEGWRLPIDINYYADNRDIFAPEVLDTDGTIDLRVAWDAATNDAPVLLHAAEQRLRSRASRP
jgi:hypothetical protein